MLRITRNFFHRFSLANASSQRSQVLDSLTQRSNQLQFHTSTLSPAAAAAYQCGKHYETIAKPSSTTAKHNFYNTKAAGLALSVFGLGIASTLYATPAEISCEGNKKDKTEESEEDLDDGALVKGKPNSFRQGHIKAYEDRIRQYSNPDKVFRYFATVRINGTVYMTEKDFLRSLGLDGLQPQTYGLDKFRDYENDSEFLVKKNLPLFCHDADGVLKANNSGLISYTEYLFLLSVLSASQRQFELAFKMFDFDSSGKVDIAEFSKVQKALLEKSTRNTAIKDDEQTLRRSSLLQWFFGKDGNKLLDYKTFLQNVEDMQTNITRLTFLSHNTDMEDRSKINPLGLAQMLLDYARVKKETRKMLLKRVKSRYEVIKEAEAEEQAASKSATKNDTAEEQKLLSFEEVFKFFRLLKAIDDLAMALHLYDSGGVKIGPSDFDRACRAVGFKFSPDIIEFVFVLFDANGDGELDYFEFVKIMKEARSYANNNRDLGFTRGLAGLVACIKEKVKEDH